MTKIMAKLSFVRHDNCRNELNADSKMELPIVRRLLLVTRQFCLGNMLPPNARLLGEFRVEEVTVTTLYNLLETLTNQCRY